MLIALLLAAAVAAGAPVPAVAVIAIAVVRPRWFLGAVVVWAVAARMRKRHGQSPDDEARFLQGVAAEVGAGASLRSALRAAATRAPDLPLRSLRAAAAGLPMQQVAAELRETLVINGKLVASAIRLSSTTGAPMGPLFSRLGVRAAERGELARERKALTAQARAYRQSSWVGHRSCWSPCCGSPAAEQPSSRPGRPASRSARSGSAWRRLVPLWCG